MVVCSMGCVIWGLFTWRPRLIRCPCVVGRAYWDAFPAQGAFGSEFVGKGRGIHGIPIAGFDFHTLFRFTFGARVREVPLAKHRRCARITPAASPRRAVGARTAENRGLPGPGVPEVARLPVSVARWRSWWVLGLSDGLLCAPNPPYLANGQNNDRITIYPHR